MKGRGAPEETPRAAAGRGASMRSSGRSGRGRALPRPPVTRWPHDAAPCPALEPQAQVIQPLNGDPFVSMLETPVTSSPLVVSYLSNLPAYRTGVAPLLRGVEIGLAHGFFLPGPFIKVRRPAGRGGRATRPRRGRAQRRRARSAAAPRRARPSPVPPPSPSPPLPPSSARCAPWRAPPRSPAACLPPASWAS
jgi:hypothetical protein